MKKQFIGDCIRNPFGDVNLLMDIVQDANEISMKTFLKNCNVSERVKQNIRRWPWDYSFHSWKKGRIYFFRHSAIERFFK